MSAAFIHIAGLLPSHRGLAALMLFVLLLLLLAAGFTALAFGRRLMHVRQNRRADRLAAKWHPVLLDVMAGDAEPDALHRLVGRRDHDAFLELILRHAFLVSGVYRRRLTVLAQPHLPAVLHQLRHRDAMWRARAAHVLGLLGSRPYASLLRDALRDPSLVVAMAAARALARTGDPVFASHILAVLHRFDHWAPHNVASLLASMGPAFAPSLVEVLLDARRSVPSRVAAAEALRWLNAADASDAAVRLLAATANRELKTAALRLLQRLGRPEHAAVARRHCRDDDDVVRLHAVSALAALGDAHDVPLLAAAVDDPSRWVRIRAMRGLRELDAYETLARLAARPGPEAHLARQIIEEEAA